MGAKRKISKTAIAMTLAVSAIAGTFATKLYNSRR